MEILLKMVNKAILENITMAFSSIVAHKMRSTLTMLGIIIGVAAVIIVVAIGRGGEEMLKSQIIGPGNTLKIYYEPSEEEILGNTNILEISPFTQQDIKSLSTISEVKKVVASSSKFFNVSYQDKAIDANVMGINYTYFDLNKQTAQMGYLFSDADYIGGNRTVIISKSIHDKLFNGEPSIGKIIRVGQQPLKIIGILEEETGMFSVDGMEIYLPWNTWRYIFGEYNYNEVTLQVIDPDKIEIAGDKASVILNKNHNTKNTYSVLNSQQLSHGIGQITRIMTIIIGSIAGIALFVGGIGVMNIILVSVTERTKEIGIRKALGATRKQILFQFLAEAVTLTSIGGFIGIIIGVSISTLISVLAGWPTVLSVEIILLALLFSMGIGIVFGILPANKASKLNPIESLRYE
ncbi:ABC transporter permease [Niallia sp. FSL R7-0271]|uniref:ABC transporter permease n=1 Tax=Niallia sp. FSL R7-0271 TaxID=2921678 RepID=UPI0030FB636D